MNATYYVVDRDGPEYQGRKGEWVRDRQQAILATSVVPGDLVRDVLRVSVSEAGVLVRSEADDHRQIVTIGFRVAWGDQYEPGAENVVTEDFFRRIVTGENDCDAGTGVWLGRHFAWSVRPNETQEIRDYVFDSRAFTSSGLPK